jgi:DNA modification methylase
MASGELSRPEFVHFLSDIMAQLVAFSMPGSIHFGCMDWRHQLEMMQAGEANYTALKNLLIWVKDNGGLGNFFRSRHELIYAWNVGKAPHVNNFGLGETGRYRTNVLEYPGCNTFRKGRKEDLEAHSTVKPTPLVADLIRDVTNPGEIVLDPCTGSGTTILAAERTKRRARCIELDPEYVDVTIRRCAAQLGWRPCTKRPV